MVRLIPRDRHFFQLFGELAEQLREASSGLGEMVATYDRLPERIAAIQRIEHTVDEYDREILARLDRAFITPIDREDIHELSSRLDDVVDRIQETAEAFSLYSIPGPRSPAVRLGAIVAEGGGHLADAVGQLDRHAAMGPHLEAIHRLEHEADGLSRTAIAGLFVDGSDPLDALKWREVYRLLEETIDDIEDAGEVIERIVAKNY